MNRVILMGRLTHDPEMRLTPQNGTSVATFDVAVDRQFKKEGQQQADFIHCVAWQKTGEFINRYFAKGKMIAVEGRLQSRSWQGNDGKTHMSYEVVVEQAHFCGGKNEDATTANTAPDTAYVENGFTDLTGESSEDDLPF